ncbi:LppU/SCO3897 family protein [Amycolatopsis benzoatilytica]|uniref:LppU/SCO3897 family protein n=1 Tax=Amycolatopsis benzoatilytica TaxID=346045 RepID=UPI00035CD3CC|nr:hypothetical protein [Amycolatopsis benzoatilytica]
MTTPPFDVPPAADPFQPPRYAAAAPNGAKRVSGLQKGLFAGLIAVALGLGTLGAFGVAAIARASGPPAVGSCLNLEAMSANTQSYSGVNCTDRAATYRVDAITKGRGSCHGQDYVRFELYLSARGGSSPTNTLCLALNVASGECVRDVSDETTVAKVACTDPKAEARAAVHVGQRSSSACGEKDLPLVYVGPPVRTICLQPTGESI